MWRTFDTERPANHRVRLIDLCRTQPGPFQKIEPRGLEIRLPHADPQQASVTQSQTGEGTPQVEDPRKACFDLTDLLLGESPGAEKVFVHIWRARIELLNPH